MAEQRLALRVHVAALLGATPGAAGDRLRRLRSVDLVTEEQSRLYRQPPCYQITAAGLHTIGSDLPPPQPDSAQYGHDVGVAWLWLVARGGAFGSLTEIVSERRMRSHDRSEGGRDEPLAVRTGSFGRGGREALHYPDLVVVTDGSRRIAIELELTGKERARREQILSGYALDTRFDAVQYLVENPSIGAAIQSSALKLGLSDLVAVQRVEFPDWSCSSSIGPGRGLSRGHARPGAAGQPQRPEARSGASQHRDDDERQRSL
jgi:hypothetical protein